MYFMSFLRKSGTYLKTPARHDFALDPGKAEFDLVEPEGTQFRHNCPSVIEKWRMSL
jgi:hypothetical protein